MVHPTSFYSGLKTKNVLPTIKQRGGGSINHEFFSLAENPEEE